MEEKEKHVYIRPLKGVASSLKFNPIGVEEFKARGLEDRRQAWKASFVTAFLWTEKGKNVCIWKTRDENCRNHDSSKEVE